MEGFPKSGMLRHGKVVVNVLCWHIMSELFAVQQIRQIFKNLNGGGDNSTELLGHCGREKQEGEGGV